MNSQIKSLSKGLHVYKYILDYGKPILAVNLCKNLNIEKSSMSRILKTLENEGFICYLDNSKEIISINILESNNKKTKIELIVEKTKYLLQEISLLTNKCTLVGIFDNYQVLYINQYNPNTNIKNLIGQQTPLHSNALGKAILAYGNYDLEKVKLHQFTTNTITKIDNLQKELEIIKMQGYSIDDKEYTKKMRCVAVPFFNTQNIFIGAVGISGEVKDLSLEKAHIYGEKISELVLKNPILC